MELTQLVGIVTLRVNQIFRGSVLVVVIIIIIIIIIIHIGQK